MYQPTLVGVESRESLAWHRRQIDGRVGGNSAQLSAEQIEGLQRQWHGYRPNQLLRMDEYSGNGKFGGRANWQAY